MAVFNLKFEQRLYHRIRCPRDGDGIENSEDPDQTAQLFENLGSLQYPPFLASGVPQRLLCAEYKT